MNTTPFRLVIRALFSLAALALMVNPAWADGVHVKSTLDLPELVKKSAVIVTATIETAKANWTSRVAYGQDHKYVSHFEFRMKVDGWVKGTPFPGADKPIVIGYRGDPPPGKWALVEEEYRTQFSPHGAKVGDRVIVFVEEHGAQQWALEGGTLPRKVTDKAVESIALLSEVKRQVATETSPTPVPSRPATSRSK
jgi:hypothetical protein